MNKKKIKKLVDMIGDKFRKYGIKFVIIVEFNDEDGKPYGFMNSRTAKGTKLDELVDYIEIKYSGKI